MWLWVPGAPGNESDWFRTMEFSWKRWSSPGLAGMQPITPGGMVPTQEPRLWVILIICKVQQQVAFNF